MMVLLIPSYINTVLHLLPVKINPWNETEEMIPATPFP
jgi:hypothetical protein